MDERILSYQLNNFALWLTHLVLGHVFAIGIFLNYFSCVFLKCFTYIVVLEYGESLPSNICDSLFDLGLWCISWMYVAIVI